MTIDLGTKLTSINFDIFIKENWNNSIASETKAIDFSFKRLEWIGYEQLTFIIGWIDRLVAAKKTVNVYLQESSDIANNTEVFNKREKCLKMLLVDWRFQSLCKNATFIGGGINPKGNNISKNIPFEHIPTIDYNLNTFEEDFKSQYDKHLSSFKSYSENEFRANTDLSYFDNHYLNYSIIKELYSNVCQHAYQSDQFDSKCYISLSHSKKIGSDYQGQYLQRLLAARYSERPPEEKNYFINLKGEYSNRSYLEFTFLDFGEGIASTLKNKYNSVSLENISPKLAPAHSNQNLETRVLEYSFLLFSSKYEFSEDLRIHDYIPRGLYIIKDIVKRYNGLLIARSKKGKVVFDFSKSQVGDLGSNVRYRSNDFDEQICNFPGTSISIILPTKNAERKENTDYRSNISSNPEFEFVNILKLYSKFNKHIIAESQKEFEKRFYEDFFNSLCNTLGDYNNRNEHILVCFDFAGVSHQNTRFYSKLIYFLSYSPLINEKVNAIMFNVLDKGIKIAQVELEQQSQSVGFFPHVIPCIHPDLEVSWIGIHENLL
ncbi:MAG: hypothetical protein ACJ76F_01575, partial [Bacteroidia bacterium]